MPNGRMGGALQVTNCERWCCFARCSGGAGGATKRGSAAPAPAPPSLEALPNGPLEAC